MLSCALISFSIKIYCHAFQNISLHFLQRIGCLSCIEKETNIIIIVMALVASLGSTSVVRIKERYKKLFVQN